MWEGSKAYSWAGRLGCWSAILVKLCYCYNLIVLTLFTLNTDTDTDTGSYFSIHAWGTQHLLFCWPLQNWEKIQERLLPLPRLRRLWYFYSLSSAFQFPSLAASHISSAGPKYYLKGKWVCLLYYINNLVKNNWYTTLFVSGANKPIWKHCLFKVKSFTYTAHSCFSRSMNCGAATMGNGFQVTVLDSEALES